MTSEEIKQWLASRFAEFAILRGRDGYRPAFESYLHDMDGIGLHGWAAAYWVVWKREQGEDAKVPRHLVDREQAEGIANAGVTPPFYGGEAQNPKGE